MKKINEKDFELEFRKSDKDFNDLYGDFLFVKDLNRVISVRYNEVLSCFPTSEEINFLIKNNKDEDRLFKLKKFLSAIKSLEKTDIKVKSKPYKELQDD